MNLSIVSAKYVAPLKVELHFNDDTIKTMLLHFMPKLHLPPLAFRGTFWWLLVVTAFLHVFSIVTLLFSTTSIIYFSPLFIRRDKNGTKPENKISKNTFEPIKSLRHIALRLQSFCKRAH